MKFIRRSGCDVEGSVLKSYKFSTLLLPLVVSLASCGNDGPFQLEDVGRVPELGIPRDGGSSGTGGNWQAGLFQPAANFKNRCASPRSSTDDISGTTTDENN